MPVDQTQEVTITCDNPKCPGNELDPHNRVGWFFVSSEIYGEPTQSHVFCSNKCASAAATDKKSTFAKSAPQPTHPTPPGPVE